MREARRRSRIPRTLARPALATAMALTVTGLSAGSAAAADLVVESVAAEGIGSPPFLLMQPNGSVERFSIHVEVKNVGQATAGKSQLLIEMKDFKGTATLTAQRQIRSLAKDDKEMWTIPIRDFDTSLGFIEVKATADPRHKIPDAHRQNNTLEGRKIAVIPERWNVAAMQVQTDLPGGTSTTTSTLAGFHFKFADFQPADEEFIYSAFGELGSTTTLKGFCNGTGSATPIKENPWENSDLTLGARLDEYTASIETHSLPPYTVHVVCAPSTPMDVPEAFHDPLTFKQFHKKPKMSPDDGSLAGSGTDPGIDSTFKWLFNADVPADRTSLVG